MKKILIISTFLFILFFAFMENIYCQKVIEKDTIKTSEGNLIMHFVGHASLMFEYKNKVIQIDPTEREFDYSLLPKADIVLITHEHGDHFDTLALNKTKKEGTKFVITQICANLLNKKNGIIILQNGQNYDLELFKIETVPAYNIVNKRSNGEHYHPKGNGNGYILTFADKRIYVAGDTEDIPEMSDFKDIDVAFLPMNLPYTMSVEMCANSARMFKPKILYPYHFGKTDTNELLKLLSDDKSIEIRIKNLP